MINNVGVIDRKKFFELSPEEVYAIIKVNMFPTAMFTKYAKNQMKKN